MKRRGVLPGFGLSLGFTLLYLSLVILIPISTIFLKTATLSWADFWETVSSPRTLAAYRLSFGAAFVAALVNLVFGLLVAWVLERYEFSGKRLVDGLVDLPFALPTAVAGIALSSIYAGNGWLGRWLEPLGIKVAYTPLGVIVALTFVGLPFVVRTVQPVLARPRRRGGGGRGEPRRRAADDLRARHPARARCRRRRPASCSPSPAASASTARSSSSPATCRCAPRSRRC